MIELYKLAKTKIERKLFNDDGEEVVVPAGAEAHVLDRLENEWYTIEFVDHDVGYPTTADYMEDELEMVEED